MHAHAVQLVRGLLFEEVERIVADASGDGRIVKAGRHASVLLRAYPNCGLSATEVVNEIGAVAACAGVPVELSRADDSIVLPAAARGLARRQSGYSGSSS